jgi:hypothetical protein
MMAMAIIRGDDFTLAMMGSGFFFGGLGWLVAMKGYVLSVNPLKNGKYIFGKLYRNGLIDGWKIMEFTQGCFNGLGIAGAFIIGWPIAAKNLEQAEAAGKLWYMLPEKVDTVLSWVFCAIIILTIFLFIIPYRRNGNKITKAFGEVDMNIVEVIERPCYMVAPLALIMLGSTTMAGIICCFTMYYVIAQHDGLERYCDYKGVKLIRAFLILLGAAILAVQAIRGYTLWETWIFYCVGYILFDLAAFARPKTVKENWQKSKSFKQFLIAFGGSLTVMPFFYILAAGLLVFGYVNFR